MRHVLVCQDQIDNFALRFGQAVFAVDRFNHFIAGILSVKETICRI